VPIFLGFLGVLAFSFTLPATRVAVEELDPTFVGIGREAIAAVLAGVILIAARAPLPTRPQLFRIAIVASGVAIGWPIFTAFALRGLTSAHSAVIVGVLPAATAVVAVLRAGERPSAGFWAASFAGLAAVLECAAIGVPAAHGEDDVLVAVIVRDRSTFDPAALVEFLEPRMPRFMVPRYVQVVEDLPRTEASMRVRKHELRARGVPEGTYDRDAE